MDTIGPLRIMAQWARCTGALHFTFHQFQVLRCFRIGTDKD